MFKLATTDEARIVKMQYVLTSQINQFGIISAENKLLQGISANGQWHDITNALVAKSFKNDVATTPHGILYTRSITINLNYFDSDTSVKLEQFLRSPIVVRCEFQNGVKVLLSSQKYPMRTPSVSGDFAANAIKNTLTLTVVSPENLIFWDF